MDIKPIDILNKSFNQGIRGYNKVEVDDFMRQISESFEELLTQHTRLLERTEIQDAEIKRYKDIENSLNSTLILAQKTSDDMRANAKAEAELILREARASASEELELTRLQIDELKKNKMRFETEFRVMLKSYLELCEGGRSGGESGNTGK